MERLLLDLSINVTSMFRDPTFYSAFRVQVVPLLKTYPFTRIWVAGCSTGEEVYSLAILLQEEGDLRPDTDLRDRHQRGGARAGPRRRVPARQDAGVHGELHPRGWETVLLRVLPGEVRRRALRSRADRERRLRAAQPRPGPLLQRVQRDPLPQRDDLLRPRAPEPRPRAVPRQPRDVRDARPRPQGIDPIHAQRERYEELDAPRRIYRKVDESWRYDRRDRASWGGLEALAPPARPARGPRRRGRGRAAPRARLPPQPCAICSARDSPARRRPTTRTSSSPARSTSQLPTTTCSSSRDGSRCRPTSPCSTRARRSTCCFETAADVLPRALHRRRAHRRE